MYDSRLYQVVPLNNWRFVFLNQKGTGKSLGCALAQLSSLARIAKERHDVKGDVRIMEQYNKMNSSTGDHSTMHLPSGCAAHMDVGVVAGGGCDIKQTTKFLDAVDTNIVRVPTGEDPTTRATSSINASLAEFLARPVQIKTATWATGVSPNFAIYPWELWGQNAYVKAKLDHYQLLRGDLMIKVTVNGSPFHYGKAVMHYYPLQVHSDLVADNTTATLHTTAHTAVLAKATSRQHIVIDPSTNSGGCMCLPFLWPDNMFNIPQVAEFQQMGTLYLTAMADIKSTGASFTEPEIMVYAWLENARLEIPTRSEAMSVPAASLLGALVAQGEFDEQPGVISGPAGVVAALAGKLTRVPGIAPFALATNIGATAVGNIAKIFGFSKPASIAPVGKMRREPDGGLAATIGVDCTNKLSCDPKAEVTVDPRTVGLGDEDQMAISYIASREALLTQFEWVVGGVPTLIFGANVNPYQAIKHDVNANSSSITPTPLSFASLPFQFWTGSLIYRFEVMCSAMHRGRLGICFDPNGFITSTDTNTNYMTVLDLSDTKNVEVRVSWASSQPLLQVRAGRGSTWVQTGSYVVGTNPAPMSKDLTNGYLSVNVINSLQCNISSADVYVNVYVRGGDDFRLSAPHDAGIHQVSYHPYASLLGACLVGHGEDETPLQDNDPEGSDVKVDLVSTPMSNVDMMSSIYNGDPMVTFRSLLKRYCLSESITMFDVTSGVEKDLCSYRLKFIEPNFPRYYGYDPNGMYEVGAAKPYSPCLVTLMNYLTPAYAGWRGATRVKYFPQGQAFYGNGGNTMQGYIERTPIPIDATYSISQRALPNFLGGLLSQAETTHALDVPAFAGASVEVQSAQKSFAIELPYYNNKRFCFAQQLDINTGNTTDGSRTFRHSLKIDRRNGTALDSAVCADTVLTTQDLAYQKWTAAGDDFSLFGFINPPTHYLYTSPKPLITKAIEV